jgi:hypothetical protein
MLSSSATPKRSSAILKRGASARIDHIDTSMMTAEIHLIEGPDKGWRRLLNSADLERAPVTPVPANWRRASYNPGRNAGMT